MRVYQHEEKITELIESSKKNIQFENHMPEEVGKFLKNASKGVFEEGVIEEDIAFAKSLSEVFNEQ